MMTYLLLNFVFLSTLAGLYFYSRKHVHARSIAISLLIVVALTAVFDPIMIAIGLVAYDPSKLLGLYLFGAPIEDFAYAVFAVPFVASLWTILEKRND